MKKKIFAGAMALLIGLSAVGCGSKTGTTENGSSGENSTAASSGAKSDGKISFVLDWTPNTNHTGVYVALEKGFYAEEGLNIEIIQPPEDGAIAAVGSGQAQFGVSFQENLGEVLASANPAPVTAVATIIDHNTSGIISLREKDIESFKDLEGKKYATWGLPVEQAILKFAVESDGGDYSKIEMVPHSGADAVSLLKTGQVDAVWVYEAWDNVLADLDGMLYNFIPFAQANSVLDFYTPIIIANDEFLISDPDTAKAFMNATAKGYQFAIANPHEAAEILLKAVPELDVALVEESQQILSAYYKAEKEFWGPIDTVRWETFYDFMYAQELIDKPLGSAGFTNDYLPNV